MHAHTTHTHTHTHTTHTHIHTQTFASPVNDYKLVRQKLATQKRNARKGLSKLLAKTRPSHAIFGEADPYGVFTGEWSH